MQSPPADPGTLTPADPPADRREPPELDPELDLPLDADPATEDAEEAEEAEEPGPAPAVGPGTTAKKTALRLVRALGRGAAALGRTWRDVVTVAAPALVTALVVGFEIGRPQLWRDELATWSAATRTVPEIFALGHTLDGVLVPYYLFMHYWVGWFGDSTTALRMPSLLAMAGAAAMVAVLGRRLYGRRAGLLGGMLLATVPAVSRYGQEARGYAFAAFFAVLSTLLLTRALDRPSRRDWIGYGATVLLLGWSHQMAVLVVAGHAVAVGFAWRRTGRKVLIWWLIVVGLAGVALLPMARTGLAQRGVQLPWLETAEPEVLAGLIDSIFLSGIVGGAICAIAAFALRARSGRLLWACVLLPVGVLYAADQLVAPIFIGRYVLFVVPLVCVLAGRGLSAMRLPVAAALIVLLGAIGLPAQLNMRREHSTYDYRAAADLIEASAQPGDGIVYGARDDWVFTDLGVRYWEGDRLPRDVLRLDDEVRNASFWSKDCADPGLCLGGVDRVWGLSPDNLRTGRSAGATDRMTGPVQLALKPFRVAASWRVDGYTLVLFVRATPLPEPPPPPSPQYVRDGPGWAG